jgi:hypothetical protein
LGLSPQQLEDYTYNDILEDAYRAREESKIRESVMQRQAWYNWMASTNRPMFGQKEFEFRPFDELFRPPEEHKAIQEEEFSELVDACQKMGITPPKR